MTRGRRVRVDVVCVETLCVPCVVVSVLEDSAPPRLRLLVPVIIIAVAMIALYTAGVTELLIAAIFAAGIMMACGALSEQEARDAVNWDVIVTIAAAFGMSRALQNSGVAGTVAARLVQLAELSAGFRRESRTRLTPMSLKGVCCLR